MSRKSYVKITGNIYFGEYITRCAERDNELVVTETGVRMVCKVYLEGILHVDLVDIDKSERPFDWGINPITMMLDRAWNSSNIPACAEVSIHDFKKT